MESRTKNRKTPEQIERMATRAFEGVGLAAGEDCVLELEEGWFNAVYRIILDDGRETILKIAPPPGAEVMTYEANIMATEVACMRRVRANAAIPVPEIYCFDQTHDECDSDYFFMEKLHGDNLDAVAKTLPMETLEAIELQVGEIIRELNRITGSYYGYDGSPQLRASNWRDAFIKIMDALLEDGRRKSAEFDYSYEDLRAAVLSHARALEEVTTPRLVHWDAWNANFFVSDARVTGLIDFERALWGDPLMEAQFRQFGDDRVTPSMRGYGKTSFTSTERERRDLYSLHLALTMNVECYYRNYDTNRIFDLSRQLIAASMARLQ